MLAVPMVSEIEASVVGSVPPPMITAVGVPTNSPPSTTTGAEIAPVELVVVRDLRLPGIYPVCSIAGFLMADTLAGVPPEVVTKAGAATLPQPPPPAVAVAEATVCMTQGVMVYRPCASSRRLR